MDKWYYIDKISKLSNQYGDKLLDMMANCNKTNLYEITYEEAKEYYVKLNKE